MPKCRQCGKENTHKEQMYLFKNGKQNCYFCNEEHYISWNKENEFKKYIYEDISYILRHHITNTLLYSEVNGLCSIYGADNVRDYISDNKTDIEQTMNSKDFNSEFLEIRYLTAIIKNNMRDYINNKPRKTYEFTAENIVMDFGEYKHVRKQKKSLAEVMEENNE